MFSETEGAAIGSEPIIVFVCEHGAAKSIVAAAYSNKLAREAGLTQRAIARATQPEPELSAAAVSGLDADGLTPTESKPRKVRPAELLAAQNVIAFCEVDAETGMRAPVEHWDDVPPVSEDYARARDAILAHLRQLLERL